MKAKSLVSFLHLLDSDAACLIAPANSLPELARRMLQSSNITFHVNCLSSEQKSIGINHQDEQLFYLELSCACEWWQRRCSNQVVAVKEMILQMSTNLLQVENKKRVLSFLSFSLPF